jgi:hypothetical protein
MINLQEQGCIEVELQNRQKKHQCGDVQQEEAQEIKQSPDMAIWSGHVSLCSAHIHHPLPLHSHSPITSSQKLMLCHFH